MPEDPRFSPLFQPLKIGPVMAPSRFRQVLHCTGIGNLCPRKLAPTSAAVHELGALAAADLWHDGQRSGNVISPEAGMSPESHLAKRVTWQSQRMGLGDVRAATGKPVVSVGRYDNLEAKLTHLRRGVLDFIAVARGHVTPPAALAMKRERVTLG